MLLSSFVQEQGFALQLILDIIIKANKLNALEPVSNSSSNITVLFDFKFELSLRVRSQKSTKSYLVLAGKDFSARAWARILTSQAFGQIAFVSLVLNCLATLRSSQKFVVPQFSSRGHHHGSERNQCK